MSRFSYLAKILMVIAISQVHFSVAAGAANAGEAAMPPKRSGLQPLADKTATGGWEALRSGQIDAAQYRFKQALVFDKANGLALWGMAVIHAQKGEYGESLKNFAQAETTLSDDVNFQADFSRTLGHAGVAANNPEMIQAAIDRFKKIYEEHPQYGANLQNWAIISFYTGNYAQAWEKIGLAERAAEATDIDPKFLAELQSRMPRP